MNHFGTVTFETKRLICRKFVLEDDEDMLKNWIFDPCVQNEYGEVTYTTIAQVRNLLMKYISAYQKADFYRWAIIEKKSHENIGQIAFCKVYSDCQIAEIEYCIGKMYWGHGYAGEALAGVIDFTFKNTDFLKLEAYHRCKNIKSGKVLAKSPMHITDTVERLKRENRPPHDEICYCIEKTEYKI